MLFKGKKLNLLNSKGSRYSLISIKQYFFSRFYDRGDLPLRVDHKGSTAKAYWKYPPEQLDYHHYLPLFFDGLREKMDPYRSLSIMGTSDLLDVGREKILPVIPQLIIPIKSKISNKV